MNSSFKLNHFQSERINTITPSSTSSSPTSIILNNDNSGSIIFCDPVNYATTFYLPPVDDGLNFRFIFKSAGINNITINAIDISTISTTYTSQITTNLIYGLKSSNLVNSLVLNSIYIGDCFDFISDGTNWFVNYTTNKPQFNTINFNDDFTQVAPNSGTTGLTATDNSGNWVFTGSDGDFILTTKNISGGVWEIETDADDNDQVNLFGNRSFLLESKKDLYFKARFRIISVAANHHGFFIGLTSNNAVDFIDDNCAAYDDGTSQSTIGFLRPADDGDLLYKAVLQNVTTENTDKTASGEGLTLSGTANAVQNNWITCEMYVNDISAADTSHFKIIFNLKDETTGVTHSVTKTSSAVDSAYASQVTIGPAICLKTGASSALEYEVDYIYVCQTR